MIASPAKSCRRWSEAANSLGTHRRPGPTSHHTRLAQRTSAAGSFFLCLPRGQSLGQPDLEIGPAFVQRAIEEIVHHIQTACFVRFQLIDIAVFENATGERQLLRGVVDQQRAFHELATIIAGENALAPKIKLLALKAFTVYDALIRRISRDHFLFGRSTRTSRNSSGPLVSRRRRCARSSGGAAGSAILSIVFAASSAARNLRSGLLTGLAGAFTVRPSSTKRRMASESVGVSGWFSAHLTIDARITGSARKPIIGALPVAGRPMGLFVGAAFFIIYV